MHQRPLPEMRQTLREYLCRVNTIRKVKSMGNLFTQEPTTPTTHSQLEPLVNSKMDTLKNQFKEFSPIMKVKPDFISILKDIDHFLTEMIERVKACHNSFKEPEEINNKSYSKLKVPSLKENFARTTLASVSQLHSHEESLLHTIKFENPRETFGNVSIEQAFQSSRCGQKLGEPVLKEEQKGHKFLSSAHSISGSAFLSKKIEAKGGERKERIKYKGYNG